MSHEVSLSLSSMLFTCAVDKTGAVWDCEVGERVKKLKGHTSFVNSICPARRGLSLLVTGSDDGNIKVELPNNYNYDNSYDCNNLPKVWDVRKKGAVQTFNNTYQVRGCCFFFGV